MNNFLNETERHASAIKRQIKQISIKCLDKLSLFALEKDEVDCYIKEYLEPFIFIRPFYWFTNPLVKVIKEHVGNELPTCFLFSIERIENSNEFLEALNTEIARYQNKIFRDEDLTEEECKELLTVSKLNIGLDEKMVINYILKKIINGRINISKEFYEEVFISYAELIKNENDLPVYISVSDKLKETLNDKGQIIIPNAYVANKNGSTRLKFNRKILVPSCVLDNLFVLFHEHRHLVQDDDRFTSLRMQRIFQMDKYLSNTKGGYETTNYHCLSYESDANLYGYIMLYQYLNHLGISRYNSELFKKMFYYNNLRYSMFRKNQFGEIVDLKDYFTRTVKSYGGYSDIEIRQLVEEVKDSSTVMSPNVLSLVRKKKLKLA